MGKMIEAQYLKKLPEGSIMPIYGTENYGLCAVDYFAKISDYGRKENSILLESADIVKKYGEKSIGGVDPCIKARGRGEKFEVIALNRLGKKFLQAIKDDFGFADKVSFTGKKISGTLAPEFGVLSEEERLRKKTHADVLRAIAFRFRPTIKPFPVYGGLFGVISYDFIDQFEKLPKNKSDILKEPDYEMNFYDSIFLVDHSSQTINFVANMLVMGNNHDEEIERCGALLDSCKRNISSKMPEPKQRKFKPGKASTDTPKKEFEGIVAELKQNVLAGDVFQVVPSRTVITDVVAEPLDVYRELRKLNPSPYMFYFRHSAGTLLGSSPETFIRVEGDGEKTVEIRPIAGTKPRGIVNGRIDLDLDSRYEAELKLDRKELAEHTMLIDLARNDVAKVCEPGTRHCSQPYIIEKYSHVQHIVSNVSGTLKKDLDALHAYIASMNMGTLTGAPKVEAMKLIRLKEKNKRGFYGGSIGYITPEGNMDTAIIIRSMSISGGKAYIRAGAGIVLDSVPEKEFDETERKAGACLKAVELANASSVKGQVSNCGKDRMAGFK